MGDTENGSWNSRELGGYYRREQCREDWQRQHAPQPVTTRRMLFLLAWPVRAALAMFALLLGACICPDGVVWEVCKRDVRDMLKMWPK